MPPPGTSSGRSPPAARSMRRRPSSNGSVYWGTGYARSAEGSGNNKLYAFSIGGVVDTTAPTTAITLTPAAPNGTNGWYRTPVGVTVTAARQRGRRGCLPDALRARSRDGSGELRRPAGRRLQPDERVGHRRAHALRGERGQEQQRREPARHDDVQDRRDTPHDLRRVDYFPERQRLVQRRRRRSLHLHRLLAQGFRPARARPTRR